MHKFENDAKESYKRQMSNDNHEHQDPRAQQYWAHVLHKKTIKPNTYIQHDPEYVMTFSFHIRQ